MGGGAREYNGAAGLGPRRGFRADERGSIAIKFALFSSLLLGILGISVSHGLVVRDETRLQGAVDAAALAAAREIGLADFKSENVQAIVEAVVAAFLAKNHDNAFADGAVDIDTDLRSDPLEVEVTARQSVESPFAGILKTSLEDIEVRAVARVVGRPNVCVLGLDPDENGTISLEQQARVTGKNCAVFSNSSHKNSIKAKNSATMTASLICARGGKSGAHYNFTPDPITDCPSFEDPLASRPEPDIGSCSANDLVLNGVTRKLEPGTYCGGLMVTAGAKVSLDPGIYVFKDGPLVVEGSSTLEGDGVGLFFSGAGAVFDFKPASSISLSAPEDGGMAGLLFFESRSQSTKAKHRIGSDDARKLLGTVYLSRGELIVDADNPVADQSAYTAIVARAMRLYGGPHLVLNTNYNLTPVPVPDGIKGADQPVSLVK